MDKLQKHHVTSGSYYVSRNTPLILQAFLGTCVGVALYDGEAGVGGLVHLLLPEPVGAGSSFQPEKYASTGLPIFLRALCDEGASKKAVESLYCRRSPGGSRRQQRFTSGHRRPNR